MDDAEGTNVPDTTHLRQAIGPELRQRLGRILAHAQEVRAWAAGNPALTDAERATVLEQIEGVEQTVRTLDESYALLESPAPDAEAS
jgi:hypothetical protein